MVKPIQPGEKKGNVNKYQWTTGVPPTSQSSAAYELTPEVNTHRFINIQRTVVICYGLSIPNSILLYFNRVPYNWVLSTGLIMWIGHRKEIRKLTFRALALRRSEFLVTRTSCFTCWDTNNSSWIGCKTFPLLASFPALCQFKTARKST